MEDVGEVVWFYVNKVKHKANSAQPRRQLSEFLLFLFTMKQFDSILIIRGFYEHTYTCG